MNLAAVALVLVLQVASHHLNCLQIVLLFWHISQQLGRYPTCRTKGILRLKLRVESTLGQLGVVLPHPPCEIFRAIFRQLCFEFPLLLLD